MCHLCLLSQQLMRERQQMASRPFASVAVSLDAIGELTEVLQPVIDGAPKPVAMEPCFGGKAAVLTVLMRLPSGLSDLPPPGQSGLIVASALVDISQQKPSDFKDKSQALKNRKALPPAHQGTCV
ncbi:Attractin-like protein 1 [Characodon lateralis]|uniref:Attractin-like protein 1 n=1 Tax=Characodon lateralis TaxID=208331 RepID=A0ABU7CWJ2_9TELE|nr:Attractin-like protein 1 [Characodon lateralis]